VFPSLCGERVLVTGFLGGGISVNDTAAMDRAGIDRKEVARTFLDVFLSMMIQHGVFHADPHPGNLLVLPDGRIGLLDFGMVGRLTKRRRFELLFLVSAVLDGRPERLLRALRMVEAVPPTADLNALENDLASLLRLAQHAASQDPAHRQGALGAVFERLAGLMPRYHVRIPPEFQLVLKALATVESTVVALGDDLDPSVELHAGLERLAQRTVGEELQKGMQRLAFEYVGAWLLDSAAQARQALDQVAEVPPPESSADRVGRAMVGSAMMVTVALLWSNGILLPWLAAIALVVGLWWSTRLPKARSL
jgi:predicted unusual protein kinase regulating ubiquinone biosynthesis (AarF/ABC1/UbiB family)